MFIEIAVITIPFIWSREVKDSIFAKSVSQERQIFGIKLYLVI